MSIRANWYEQLFGAREGADYTSAQTNFELLPASPTGSSSSSVLHVLANGRVFPVGTFETPTLGALRAEALSRLAMLAATPRTPFTPPDTVAAPHTGTPRSPFSPAASPLPPRSARAAFRFRHKALGDVLEIHARHPGALFQAASQFNCLEFPRPSHTPEHGVTDYAQDRTQGPACSLACAAATVVRNYLVDVAALESADPAAIAGPPALDVASSAPPTPPLERQRAAEDAKRRPDTPQEHEPSSSKTTEVDHHHHLGQRVHRQLNNLHLVEAALHNEREQFFRVHSGYVRATPAGLDRLAVALSAQRSTAQLKDLLKIGMHWDVGVTFAARFEEPPRPVVVSQAFCSALSCAYNFDIDAEQWEPFARLVLEAAYEATLWAATLNALREGGRSGSESGTDRDAEHGGGRFHHRVYLTFLGAGAFGNDMRWVCESMGRAMAAVAVHRAPIEVVVGHYRRIDRAAVHWIAAAYSRELERLGGAASSSSAEEEEEGGTGEPLQRRRRRK